MTSPTYKPGDIVIVPWPIPFTNNGLTTAPAIVTSVNSDGTVNCYAFVDKPPFNDQALANVTPIS